MRNGFRLAISPRPKDCLCRVTFDLTRKDQVLIDCLESLHELVSGLRLPLFRFEEPFQISLPGMAKQIECYISGTFTQPIIGDDPSVYLTLRPSGSDAFIDYGSPLFRVDGGIANFKRYRLGGDRTIRLDEGTWKFELEPVEESGVYPAQIQNQSYSFTHHLLLQTREARSFSWSQAQKALEALSTFLSFCAERWVAPALVKGYDKSGGLAIQDWRSARIDPCERRGNWLDEYHASAMAETFPGFARLMDDAEWRETIRTAVYWYVRADTNHVGPDGAIILVQTALERLPWHILVRVRRSISERSFSELPAADQL
jgi:hypothetical protein